MEFQEVQSIICLVDVEEEGVYVALAPVAGDPFVEWVRIAWAAPAI